MMGEKGICKNCGKETEGKYYLQALAEVIAVSGKVLDMCSEKCCEEYAKQYENESAFVRTIFKEENGIPMMEQTIINKEKL